jgi:hypothetical protein
MSIIVPNDYSGGEQAIAQLSNSGVRENVQAFIDEYEPIFLKELLGTALANEFIAGLAVEPIDPKWLSLRDETDLKPALKSYIYFYYMENLTTTTAGTSEVKTANENSNPASNWDKNVKAWNKMVKITRVFDLSTDDYPDYVRPYWGFYSYWWPQCPIKEIYYYKNSLNF